MFNEKIKEAFEKIKQDMLFLSQEILMIKQELQELRQILGSNRYSTHVQNPTDNPTHNLSNYGLIQQNFHSSIRNEGVPTDSQQTVNRQSNTLKRTFNNSLDTLTMNSILSSIKHELKEKFKKLTRQEFLIFSVLYTLEEELKVVTYRDIAQRTGLAESSVRDYISRLEYKGLPIIKEKINNRIVVLKIPREFKEIATINQNLASNHTIK